MSELVLVGIDGSNPLGFLAALGACRSASEQGLACGLSWRLRGRWRPVLHGVEDPESLLDILEAERDAWRSEPLMDFHYEVRGKLFREVKPPPALWRAFLIEQGARSAVGQARGARQVAALASELVQDNNGNTKPTALHFAAGQQRFLETVRDLAMGVSREHFRQALFGPWSEHSFKSFAWDATVFRDYALRASDPSKDKKGAVPGAEWLAFVGLGQLPVAPVAIRGELRLQTTGCTGGWKTGVFTWPLWDGAASSATIRSVMQLPDLAEMTASERVGRGIAAVFSARITRSEQGGYGGFTPAAVR